MIYVVGLETQHAWPAWGTEYPHPFDYISLAHRTGAGWF